MKTLIFLITFLTLAAVGLAHAQEGRITVTGTGTVEAKPDMAIISVGVTQHGDDAQTAMQQVSASVARVLSRLGELGVAPRDIQTRDLNLSPVWSDYRSDEKQKREITGFSASNRVVVRIRDLGELGPILGAVVSDGANDFGGLQFTVADPKQLTDEARAKAVADATDKAQQLAKAANVALGGVVSITEGGSGPRPAMRMAEMSAASASVPVAAGEVALSVNVSMVFEVEQ